ncbi:MAG: metallophosphoesterase [Oscillospiraceae bacterium]|nr:metallophosphoesterase [Oscillospiraceae bacterium]
MKKTGRFRTGKFILAAAGAALAGAVAADAMGPPEITEYDVYSEKITDELDGYTIAHISDFHCACIPGLVGMIKRSGANIIVSTGDTVNGRGSVERAVSLTGRLAEIAPLYMVTGNHDEERAEHKKVEKACIAGGGEFLHNESTIVSYKNSEIMISGSDDPAACGDEAVRLKTERNIEKSIENTNDFKGFRILLFHRANLAPLAAGYGFDLILSGHMHGGQIRIPGIGGVLSPRKNIMTKKIFFPEYTGGKYTMGASEVIVSRGLGNPVPLPRICNRPEIVIIKLRRKITG